MKDWKAIVAIIAFVVTVAAAVALIIVYKDKIGAFLLGAKDKVADGYCKVKDKIIPSKAEDVIAEEAADFADL